MKREVPVLLYNPKSRADRDQATGLRLLKNIIDKSPEERIVSRLRVEDIAIIRSPDNSMATAVQNFNLTWDVFIRGQRGTWLSDEDRGGVCEEAFASEALDDDSRLRLVMYQYLDRLVGLRRQPLFVIPGFMFGYIIDACNGMRGMESELGLDRHVGHLFQLIASLDGEQDAVTFQDGIVDHGDLTGPPKALLISSFARARG